MEHRNPREPVLKVYQAINAVQRALAAEGISKDRRNQQQGYNFRGIDDVYNVVSPLLGKNGLCILPRVLSRSCVERVNAKGTALFYVTIECEFDLVSTEDASKHTVKTYGEAMDSGDKATNKAMSAAYKYAVMQTFAIPTEGDNDADATTHEVEANSNDPLLMFTRHEQAVIRKAAQSAIVSFNEGQEYSAYEEVTTCIDKIAGDNIDKANTVRMALWVIFKPHSALRSSLKKHSDQERQQQQQKEPA